MNLQLGMPTLLEAKPPEACAVLCKELGLDFVELNMNLPEYQVESIHVSRLMNIAARYGIYFTIHLDENLNPCDFNERVAWAHVETVIRAIEIAKLINAPILNMHLAEGVYFTLPDHRVYLFDEYEAIYLRKLKTFRDACANAITDANITICVENTNGYRRAAFLLKGLDLLLESPAFALTFDIGHNAGADHVDEALILDRFLKLSHFHIHDAKGKRNHLPLGEGELDLNRYLRMAGELDCRAVLETKTAEGLRRSVEWMRDTPWKSGELR